VRPSLKCRQSTNAAKAASFNPCESADLRFGINAQNKPPVLVITDISEITDPAGQEANRGRSVASVQAAIKKFGGRYLARTENITALDGTPPKRVIIWRFDSAEKAQAFYNSPEEKKVNEVRMKTTKSRSFIVEGMSQ